VARENAAGNAGQENFDVRFRALYCAHNEAVRKILRMRSGFEAAIKAEIEAIEAMTKIVTNSVPATPKGPKVSKPGSASKRHSAFNHKATMATKAKGGKKSGAKGGKKNKKSKKL
jgi:hypothetical protein